jgi:hypothetical protein
MPEGLPRGAVLAHQIFLGRRQSKIMASRRSCNTEHAFSLRRRFARPGAARSRHRELIRPQEEPRRPGGPEREAVGVGSIRHETRIREVLRYSILVRPLRRTRPGPYVSPREWKCLAKDRRFFSILHTVRSTVDHEVSPGHVRSSESEPTTAAW